MHAESLRDFGRRVGALQVTFHADQNGNVTGLTWYPDGKAAGQAEKATRVR